MLKTQLSLNEQTIANTWAKYRSKINSRLDAFVKTDKFKIHYSNIKQQNKKID
jgi:hypothetical protein